ncbi:MAG: hypothetical protein AB7G75_28285 [Candidatus Binatia bacterium]
MALVRSLYKNYAFVAGIAFILLGIGNYLVALAKVGHYEVEMQSIGPSRQTPFFLPYKDKTYFPSEAHERWEIVRAKRDFYRVVLSAGQLMMALGFLCTATSLLRLRYQRTGVSIPSAPSTVSTP